MPGDFTGRVFGSLTVTHRLPNDRYYNKWWSCRCSICGKDRGARESQLIDGKFFTCGEEFCRFWSKVNKDGPVPEHCPELGPCWLWTGAVKNKGYSGSYGVFTPKNRNQLVAHKYAWQLEEGPGKPGLFVCHKCDVELCIRKAHLFLGTPLDNSKDMVQKKRSATGVRRKHITQELADALRAEYASGTITQRGLAEKSNISLKIVELVIQGKTWIK